MNNADKPAYPRPAFTMGGEVHKNYSEAGFTNTKQDGLTKRERFAMAAMQGLLASDINENIKTTDMDVAVQYADALLKALGETA